MPEHDPIDKLAVGVAADHAAEQAAKKKGGRKPKDVAEEAGADAGKEATDAGSPADEAEALATVVEEKVDEALAPDAPNETPVAPGDDPESVFDRRTARLIQLVEDSEFESGTALGDLTTCILDIVKHAPKLWPAMLADEKRTITRQIEQMAKQILTKVVLVVAEEDLDTIHATFLGNFAVKGESIEAKIKIDGVDGDVLLQTHRLSGHRVVIVSADDKRFASKRREEVIPNDQHEIPLAFADAANDKPDGRAGPPGDDDLNPPADVKDWGVFDNTRKEWLVTPEGGDDGWTANSVDAGLWSHDEAVELAKDFDEGAGTIVSRQFGDDPAPTEDADDTDD